MSTSVKIRRLPWHCEIFTARHIKSLIRFSGLDWAKISANLEEYKDQDLAQQVASRAYLEAFKDNYSEFSKELLRKGKLDKYTQCHFLKKFLNPI